MGRHVGLPLAEYGGSRPLRRYRPLADTRLPPLRGLNRRPRNAPLGRTNSPEPPEMRQYRFFWCFFRHNAAFGGIT